MPAFSYLLFSGLLALPAAAQSLTLNGPLVREYVGTIDSVLTSPDGRFHVYALDRDGDGELELYSSPSMGVHSPRFLASPVTSFSWSITLDSAYVVLPADADHDGLLELNRIPITGSGSAVTLGGAHPNGVWILGESPASGRIVYLAGIPTELFSLPLEGGTPIRLNDPLAAGGAVLSATFLGEDRLVFLAQAAGEPAEFFVAPSDGSAPATKLPVPLEAGRSVAALQPSPDGTRVFYQADQEEEGRFELFSIASDGGSPPRKVNGPLVPGGNVGAWVTPSGPPCPQGGCAPYFSPYFLLSPDGQRLVYSAEQEEVGHFELYSAPSDGSGTPVKLGSLEARNALPILVSRDSSWVVFGDDLRFPGELLSVPIDGSGPQRRISAPPLLGASVRYSEGSSDGRHVVFAADRGPASPLELFTTPVDGGSAPVRLDVPQVPGSSLPRSDRYRPFLVFRSGAVYQSGHELYFVPVEGGVAPDRLDSGPFDDFFPDLLFEQVFLRRAGQLVRIDLAGTRSPEVLDELPLGNVVGSVGSFELTPSGDRALYLAQEQGDLTTELHTVPTDKPGLRLSLRTGLQLEPIQSLRLAPDGNHVAFLQGESVGSGTLFSAPSDGSGAPVLLNTTTGPASLFRFAPDGRRLVFSTQAPGGHSLHVVPLDGSLAPTFLLSTTGSASLNGASISADSTRLAFLEADLLLSVPLDGSTPAVPIQSSVFSDFRISPDGSTLVYRVQTSRRKIELFAAPSDGSAPPRLLSASLHARGQVTAFELAPDGSRAVYLADQRTNDVFELFSVPLDGGVPPVRLNGELAPEGDVRVGFAVSGDSSNVVYLADAFVDERIELFSAPIDAHRPPLRLSGVLPGTGDVQRFTITPDASRVVYLADARDDGVLELFSARLLGGRLPTRLSRPLVPGGDVTTFRISVDSRTVVFAAHRNSLGDRTLLAAPLDRADKAREIAGPFSGRGSVHDFLVNQDGSVVVYAADPDASGVEELFAAHLEPQPEKSKRR